MAKKSLKGHVARLATSFLRMVNMVIIAGAIATIVLTFVIRSSPTFPAGWGFIALGVMTFLSGVFGTISSGQLGCFGCHLFFCLISIAGLCSSAIIIFLKVDTVLAGLSPAINYYDAKELLRINGALYFVLFASQLVVLLLACLISSCGLIEHYEDLDAVSSAKELQQMQQEDDKRRAKIESSSAHKLAEKMKEKYGQWSQKESDYDVEGGPQRSSSSGGNAYHG